jgi:hemin uptake protein HemP
MDSDDRGGGVRSCYQSEEPEQCKLCPAISAHRVMNSEELLQGERELIIIHSGQMYRLLCTRNNKLILQK